MIFGRQSEADRRAIVRLRTMARERDVAVCGEPSRVIGAREGYTSYRYNLARGHAADLEIHYADDLPQTVLILAHELGHAWDHILDPESGLVFYMNNLTITGRLLLERESRAWEWAGHLLARIGFFRTTGGWRRFVSYRRECLATYD